MGEFGREIIQGYLVPSQMVRMKFYIRDFDDLNDET